MTPRGTTTTNAGATTPRRTTTTTRYRGNNNQEASKQHQIQKSKGPSHHQRMRRRHLHKQQHKEKKQHKQKQQQEPPSTIPPPPPPPVPPPLPVPIGSFTLYNSESDQPLPSIFSYYPLLHQSNNWTVYYKLYLSETGRDLNVNVEFNQWVDHVTYFWDGQPVRRRKDRIPPYFIGAYNEDDNHTADDHLNHHHLDSVVYDVLRFFPLTVPGNHTMIARAMKTKTELLQDFTILFQVFTTKHYLERILINAGKEDEQYLMNPERSYSFGIDYDEGDDDDHHHPHPQQDHPMALLNGATRSTDFAHDNGYGVEYFQTLRKSEYRGGGGGGGSNNNDVPIFYTLAGLSPSALHRVTVGFIETEPAYCDPQHDFFQSKSYFIFCNGDFFDHAYNILQYVPCDTVHLATGYFPSSDQGVLTVSFLSKFYPWETTVALVDVELFHVSSVQ